MIAMIEDTEMKTINKKWIGIAVWILFFQIGAHSAFAEDSKSVTTHHINNTIEHIDSAQKAINDNAMDVALEHIKFARQAAKNIIGGSYEVKAQRGSRAVANAGRQIKEGDTAGALDSLKQARDTFQSLEGPSVSGGRGGLN